MRVLTPDGAATGVVYRTGQGGSGEDIVAMAGQEVILSAGALALPKPALPVNARCALGQLIN